jgi:hypothetical protein
MHRHARLSSAWIGTVVTSFLGVPDYPDHRFNSPSQRGERQIAFDPSARLR